jgi:hypothetical protein
MLATAIAAVSIGLLAVNLPPDGFFSGDSGLKLIASFNAIRHPLRPFEIDLPEIAGQPVPYVDTMVTVHGEHAHVIQSPVFPIISAPLIAILGLRGAYVLPAVAFIVLVPLLNAMRKQAAPDTSIGILASIAVFANPLLFYSLEFWEHAPAVALAAGSSAAALVSIDRGRRAPWIVASGVLGGLAVLLRPEAVWYVAGLGLVLGHRCWGAFGGGVAAILLPFALANYAHTGTALGTHASGSLAGLTSDYFAARWQRIDVWFLPHSVPVAVGLALIAFAWLTVVANIELAKRQVVAPTGVALISVLAALQKVPRESLWQSFPLALMALVPTNASGGGARKLYVVAAVSTLGIVLTAAHDGGAQWGPRFLLVTAPALIILAAHSASDALSHGSGRFIRVGLVALILIGGLATSRVAYRELRGSKRSYARIVSTTSDVTSPTDIVLTNVWWFDQIAAPLYGTRTFLYASSPRVAADILGDLARANITHATLITTTEEAGEALDSALDGSCFRIMRARQIPERRLRFVSVRCNVSSAQLHAAVIGATIRAGR